jgi:hypothetical protein
VRVGHDKDVLVLPRHGDHFVVPRNTDVGPEEFKLREITGDVVQINRPAN